ncbi:MAG: hypothetical protein R3F30_03335 [Planctomycetota bacterium]
MRTSAVVVVALALLPTATSCAWTTHPRVDPALLGQEAGADKDALKQANNPLANFKAINVHNYHVSELSGTDETANTAWLRYAQPVATGFGDWLVRASLPLQTVPTGPGQAESGLGDANVFAAYLFDSGDPSVSYGVGPLLGLPTATADELGTDQWSAGFAAVLFDATSDQVQYGGLVTWQHKFAGEDRAPDVNILAIQPFAMLQLGGGTYFRSTGIWGFDLERGDYSVPIGFGIGHVVKAGKTVLNFFIEPQFTVLHDGPGQPEFQVFIGFNTQFMGG